MLPDLAISLQSASDSRAVVEIAGAAMDAIRNGAVCLTGPSCRYARTLPTTYVASAPSAHATSAEILIPDPCYWTPELPFLYELAAGPSERRKVGLRRLAARGASLYWEGKRVVLRGCHVAHVDDTAIADMRDAEVALIAPPPSEEVCATADEHGIPLIVDLRGAATAGDALQRLANHPAVAIVLADGDQATANVHRRPAPGLLLAAAIHSDGVHSAPPWCDVFVAELAPGQRPPSWLARCGKPVIAIRDGASYADLREARSACDCLQAELAPEFDLAGYFA